MLLGEDPVRAADPLLRRAADPLLRRAADAIAVSQASFQMVAEDDFVVVSIERKLSYFLVLCGNYWCTFW
jgi:hypothetical protein